MYRIEFPPSAEREFKHLSRQIQVRLKTRLDELAGDPRPPGVEKISGSEGLYRLREEDHRIVYQIQDEILLVLVVKVGHRRDVCRRLPR